MLLALRQREGALLPSFRRKPESIFVLALPFKRRVGWDGVSLVIPARAGPSPDVIGPLPTSSVPSDVIGPLPTSSVPPDVIGPSRRHRSPPDVIGPLPTSSRRKPGSILTLLLVVVAITDSRPCAFRRPSLVAGHFLLLAQKKVTKENGTLGAAPLAKRAVREGRTGFFYRPSLACRKNRRDPSRRPRAGHAAGPSALRRGFRGDPRARARATANGFRLSPE